MEIQKNISLKKLTTLKVGGGVDYLIIIRKKDELHEANNFAKEKNMTLLPLGEGANTYFSDRDHKKIILQIKIKGIEVIRRGKYDDDILVSAGENWDGFVLYSIKNNYFGLENLSIIPGSVGASPIQNIGAYGTEVCTYIKKIEYFDTVKSKFFFIKNKNCNFSYRDSIFKHIQGKNKIITNVIFTLPKTKNINISYKDLYSYFIGVEPKIISSMDVRQALIKIRRNKFPNYKITPTAGSFFKNPVIRISKLKEIRGKWPAIPYHAQDDGYYKIPLAWVLENIIKFKGIQRGNITCYKKQPLVLITNKQASAKELNIFVSLIKRKINNKLKIKIEREVNFVK